MRFKPVLIIAFVFFVLWHTYWPWKFVPIILDMLLGLLMFIVYCLLFLFLLIQILVIVRERFSDKASIRSTAVIAVIVGLSTIFPPTGETMDILLDRDVMVAESEGIVGCTTRLKFQADGSCMERVTCFGLSYADGEYVKKGDTLLMKWEKSNTESFGIIHLSDRTFLYYSSMEDRSPYPMVITTYNTEGRNSLETSINNEP